MATMEHDGIFCNPAEGGGVPPMCAMPPQSTGQAQVVSDVDFLTDARRPGGPISKVGGTTHIAVQKDGGTYRLCISRGRGEFEDEGNKYYPWVEDMRAFFGQEHNCSLGRVVWVP